MKSSSYNKNINIYYYNKLDDRLVDKIVKNFYYQKTKDDNLEYIKGNNSRGSMVFKLKHSSESYFIKEYTYNRISKRIENLLRGPQALRQLKKVNDLLKADFSVINPVVAITYKKNFLKTNSIFVSKEIPAATLSKELNNKLLNLNLRLKVMKKLGKLWAKLFNNNFTHQDPAIGNFLVKFLDDDQFNICLVDIDSIYQLPFLPKILIIHSLGRFFAKLALRIERNDNQILKTKERNVFFEFFTEKYRGEIKINKFKKEVNKMTVKKLLDRDKRFVAEKDKNLKRYLT